MDRQDCSSPDALLARLGCETAPIVVEVRRDADFAGAETIVTGAFLRIPAAVEAWRSDLPSGRQAATHCIHAREVSPEKPVRYPSWERRRISWKAAWLIGPSMDCRRRNLARGRTLARVGPGS